MVVAVILVVFPFMLVVAVVILGVLSLVLFVVVGTVVVVAVVVVIAIVVVIAKAVMRAVPSQPAVIYRVIQVNCMITNRFISASGAATD